MPYIWNLEEIKEFISATKEDDSFVLTIVEGTWAVLQKLIGRKLEYNVYDESHKANRDLKIYVNEPPIDVTKDITIKVLDRYYTPIIEISNYNVVPEKTFIIIPRNNNDLVYNTIFNVQSSDSYLDLNYKFYIESFYFEVIYTGGYKEMPRDLKIAFYNLIKFFYVNRDPSLSKINSEGLMKQIGELNPNVARIINSWKQVRI